MFKLILSLLLLLNVPAFAQEQSLILTPSSVGTSARGQLPGTATNDSANVGNVGEYVSFTRLVGTAVPLTTGVATDIISINLTPGDWDVWGIAITNPNAATTQFYLASWISATPATLPTPPAGSVNIQQASFNAGTAVYGTVVPVRFSVSVTTTVNLSVYSTFTVNTNGAYGILQARRVR